MNEYAQRIVKLEEETTRLRSEVFDLSKELSFFAKIIVDMCEKYPQVREDIVEIMSSNNIELLERETTDDTNI